MYNMKYMYKCMMYNQIIHLHHIDRKIKFGKETNYITTSSLVSHSQNNYGNTMSIIMLLENFKFPHFDHKSNKQSFDQLQF